MIYVIAAIELNDGARAKFLEIFKANVPAVKAEAGCIMYEPTIDFNSGLSAQKRCSENIVTIVEGWESMAHLKAHLEAPHMAAYREKVRGLAKGTTLNVLEPA